jgi:hypothetical protein
MNTIQLVHPPNEQGRIILAEALRLMAAAQNIRSIVRCLHDLGSRSADSTVEADRWVMMTALFGSSAEAARLIREFSKAHDWSPDCGVLTPAQDKTFLEAIADPQSERIRRLTRVRDKHWGHWDKGVARAAVNQIVEADYKVPLFESKGEGTAADTSYRWVRHSVLLDLLDTHQINNEREGIQQVTNHLSLASEIAAILDAAIADTLLDSKIELEMKPLG